MLPLLKRMGWHQKGENEDEFIDLPILVLARKFVVIEPRDMNQIMIFPPRKASTSKLDFSVVEFAHNRPHDHPSRKELANQSPAEIYRVIITFSGSASISGNALDNFSNTIGSD